jgi:hypothetical protein
VVKYIDIAIIACMWKWYYYTPNTLKEQHAYEAEMRVRESVDDKTRVQ